MTGFRTVLGTLRTFGQFFLQVVLDVLLEIFFGGEFNRTVQRCVEFRIRHSQVRTCTNVLNDVRGSEVFWRRRRMN